jgi:hypothetical protein
LVRDGLGAGAGLEPQDDFELIIAAPPIAALTPSSAKKFGVAGDTSTMSAPPSSFASMPPRRW